MSLKARKFVFQRTNLRAFFIVFLQDAPKWVASERFLEKTKNFADTVDFYPSEIPNQ
jgi:hypothetical protein